MPRKLIAVVLGVAVGLVFVAAPAVGKPAPVTKIRSNLVAHELVVGTDVIGAVNVFTRSGNVWAAFPAATLSLRVDKIEVGTLVTGSVTPVATAPEVPALSATPGTATVSLSWTIPADGGSAITAYNVYRGDMTWTETALITLGVVNVYDDPTALSGRPTTTW